MRRVSWLLFVLLAFAIPWEYSLDLGSPFGNVARMAVLGVVVAIIPAILRDGRFRTPGALQGIALILLLWFCISCFWTIDTAESLRHLRGYFQKIVIVWLVWELVENPADLRWLMRAYIAGAGVLAVLTILSFVSANNPEQVRFVAEDQDPNDVARFLDLAFPLSALLIGSERGWQRKLAAAVYLPLGILGVLLTASRSGLVSATVALAGCAALVFYNTRRGFMLSLAALPVLVAVVFIIVPPQTLSRLGTLPQELARGDLNQRADIWAAGWQAYVHAPFCGYGAGSFVAAAGLAPSDTAHNTALVLLVEGGVTALLIGTALLLFTVIRVTQLGGPLRIALGAALLLWIVSSVTGTVQENRATWLLMGIIASAARLHANDPAAMERAFPLRGSSRVPATLAGLAAQERS